LYFHYITKVAVWCY